MSIPSSSLVTQARRCCLHVCLVVMSFCSDLSRTRGTTGLQPDRGGYNAGLQPDRGLRFLRYSLRFSIHGPAIEYGPSKTPSNYLRDLLPYSFHVLRDPSLTEYGPLKTADGPSNYLRDPGFLTRVVF